ncbi:MAG: hypothetical protein HYY06_22375 [Deltaproteobacteria bacterium]|nr:hypothetical protein [Deltaproteobacteria bacterium]
MTDLTGRCGNCIFFTEWRPDPVAVAVGECRLGCWPSPLKATATCGSHRARGEVPRPFPVRGPRGPRGPRAPGQTEEPRRTADPHEEVDFEMERGELKELLREVLDEELGVGVVPLGERWVGGEVVLKPGRADTQEKRIPLDAFFHKIVMLRDRLRVLEAKVNGHPGLSDADKIELQQYVTRCYGSLTTFNVLFREKADQFVGQKDKED